MGCPRCAEGQRYCVTVQYAGHLFKERRPAQPGGSRFAGRRCYRIGYRQQVNASHHADGSNSRAGILKIYSVMACQSRARRTAQVRLAFVMFRRSAKSTAFSPRPAGSAMREKGGCNGSGRAGGPMRAILREGIDRAEWQGYNPYKPIIQVGIKRGAAGALNTVSAVK